MSKHRIVVTCFYIIDIVSTFLKAVCFVTSHNSILCANIFIPRYKDQNNFFLFLTEILLHYFGRPNIFC